MLMLKMDIYLNIDHRHGYPDNVTNPRFGYWTIRGAVYHGSARILPIRASPYDTAIRFNV